MGSFRFAAFVFASAWASTTHAQTLVRAVNGPAANAQFGKASLVVRDQNSDGYEDLLVGAPGFNQERGAVYCLSGAYLAQGVGVQTLWSVTPPAAPGDRFGAAIAEISDVNSDGVRDFLVGQPGFDATAANDIGALRLIDGVTHAVGPIRAGLVPGGALGTAIADLGTWDAFVVSAPGPLSNTSRVYVEGAASMNSPGSISGALALVDSAGNEFGASLAAGADLNGDGHVEIVAGAPGTPSAGGAGAGYVWLLTFRFDSVNGFSIGVWNFFAGNSPGERLGASVDMKHDYDGDGVADVIVGAPGFRDAQGGEVGRAFVLSGHSFATTVAPQVTYTLTLSAAAGLDHHFGAVVRASEDLNGDGVGDILVGAPGFRTTSGGLPLPLRGQVSVFSGSSGARWFGINGSTGDHFGDGLTGAVRDLDGDGFAEFVMSGSLADTNGTDSGVLKCYRLFPVAPAIYCTGKVNSLGCTPAISFSGTPSASTPAPFLVSATNVVNQKSGLFFYSHAPTSVAFQGGFKCAANPTVRTPPQNSGGAASGASCSGTFAFDFNDWIGNGPDPSLAPGAEVYGQYWSRDPASVSHTSLSNALRFVVNP